MVLSRTSCMSYQFQGKTPTTWKIVKVIIMPATRNSTLNTSISCILKLESHMKQSSTGQNMALLRIETEQDQLQWWAVVYQGLWFSSANRGQFAVMHPSQGRTPPSPRGAQIQQWDWPSARWQNTETEQRNTHRACNRETFPQEVKGPAQCGGSLSRGKKVFQAHGPFLCHWEEVWKTALKTTFPTHR